MHVVSDIPDPAWCMELGKTLSEDTEHMLGYGDTMEGEDNVLMDYLARPRTESDTKGIHYTYIITYMNTQNCGTVVISYLKQRLEPWRPAPLRSSIHLLIMQSPVPN